MKNIFLITSASLLLISTAFSQGLLYKQADKEYLSLRYASAAEHYETLVTAGKADDAMKLKLADSYFKIKDFKNAERVYSQVAPTNESETFQYVQCLLQNGKFEEAQRAAADDRYKSLRLRNIATQNIDQLKKPQGKVFFTGLNTTYSEFSPVYFEKGIVFASSRSRGVFHRNVFGWNNTPFLDLYYIDTVGLNRQAYDKEMSYEQFASRQTERVYAYDSELHHDETKATSNDVNTSGYYNIYYRPKQGDSLHFQHNASRWRDGGTTKFHDGPVAFHPSGDIAIVTRNNYYRGKFGKSNEGVNHLKLYLIKRSAGSWSSPQSVPFNNDQYSVGHAAFNKTGDIMYFVSDMPGGQGGTDLYQVSFSGGAWGQPKNLGESVNTNGNEMFPYVTEEEVLYFSSDGHGGLGGLDIFATNLKGKIKHAGYPMNTNKDDFGIALDGTSRKGFLSSNRNRNGIDDDIYYFQRDKKIAFTTTLEIIVVDKSTQQPIPTAQVVPLAGWEPTMTDDNGKTSYEVDPGQLYSFTGKKENYMDGKNEIQVTEEDKVQLIIPLENYLSTLYCRVTDRVSGQPLDSVKVTITDKQTNQLFLETTTSTSGDFRKILEQAKINDALNYHFKFERKGYLAKSNDFTYRITKPGEIPVHELMDIKMDKIDVGMDIGKIININPIYFDLNKSTIRKDAATELNKIVEVMKDNPNMVIELGSHTDCRSSASYNMSLSDRRAKASAQYIIGKGVEQSRIYGKGYGEAKLVNGCACEGNVKSTCSEAEHQLNRRTEFVIVKM